MVNLRTFVARESFDPVTARGSDPSFPKISVVVPTFNQASFLRRTILSILNQDYPNLELIVMDGGSADGSTQILRAYDPYIAHWTSEKDRGQADAINKGMRVATGQILAYLNSDDVYLPTGPLHRVAEHIGSRQEALLVYGDGYVIDEQDRQVRLMPALPFRTLEYLHGVFSIPQQSAFWTRRAYEAAGGFNPSTRTCLDGEFFVQAALGGTHFERVSGMLGGFRIHSTSITGSGRLDDTHAEDRSRLRKRVLGSSEQDARFRALSAQIGRAHV